MLSLNKKLIKDCVGNTEVVTNVESLDKACTTFEVFPTDRVIPAETFDDFNYLYSIFHWNNDEIDYVNSNIEFTSLQYSVDVPENNELFLEFYSYSNSFSNSDILIDWGDGNIEELSTNFTNPFGHSDVANISHIYSSFKPTVVKVYGSDYRMLRNSSNFDNSKKSIIRKIFSSDQKVASQINNVAAICKNSYQLLKIDIPDQTTCQIKKFCNAFQECYNLKFAKIGYIVDQEEVHDMFLSCTNLTTVDFKLPSLIQLSNGYKRIFKDCPNLQADILDIFPQNGFAAQQIELSEAFRNCSKLSCSDYEQLAKILWNNPALQYLGGDDRLTKCFLGCTSLELDKIPRFLGGTLEFRRPNIKDYVPLSGATDIGAIGISANIAISNKNVGTNLPGSIAYGLGAVAIGSEFNDVDSRQIKYVSTDELNANEVVWNSLNEYVLSNDGQISTEVLDVLDVATDDLVHFSEWGGFIWRKYTNNVDSNFTVEDASVEQLNSMTHVQDNYYKLYRLTNSGQISSYLYGLSGMTVTRNSSGKWVLLRTRAISKGNGSFAQGTGIAYGENSFATGGARAQSYQTFAQGGTNSFAFGRYSHAEGNSKAYGTTSHSEGASTYAIGQSSHAEGSETSAIGQCSHSEGRTTIANSYCSHSEGGDTHANGQYSHAEGFDTSAFGTVTHSSGWRTAAIGQASYADGYYTSAYGEYSHSEGAYTDANGKYSHAEGISSIASGYRSHAEGVATYAIGDGTHTEGFNVSAEGQGAHAAGFDTYAKGAGSYAAGNGTYAYGNFSEAIGYQTSAEGEYSRAYGKHTHAIGNFANAGGLNVQLSANLAYAWSGNETEYSVPASRNGTFNIDPVGDINGFYIGNRSLSEIIADYTSEIAPTATNIVSSATANGEPIAINNHSLDLGAFAIKNDIVSNDLTAALNGKAGLSTVIEICNSISNDIKTAFNLKQFAYDGIVLTDLTALNGKTGLSTATEVCEEISAAISNSLSLGELAHADKFEPLSGQTFELSDFDTRNMLKLIITSLGGKLTLNGEEI